MKLLLHICWPKKKSLQSSQKKCNCPNTSSRTSSVDIYKNLQQLNISLAAVGTEQPSAHISSSKLISCHRSETSCHSISNPQMVSLSLLTVVPASGQTVNLHGSLPWALRAVEGVEAEIKGTWIIPHRQPPLSSRFGIGGEGKNSRVECGGGWRSGKATPFFFFS